VAEENDSGSKTEEATQRKLEEARKKGDVAKSPDVASWAALAAVFGVVMSLGGTLSHNLAQALMVFLQAPQDMLANLESGGGADVMKRATLAAAPMLCLVMLSAAFAGTAGNVIQSGVLWTTAKLKPDFNKVSPMAGFKRIFGIDGMAQFVKTLIKLIITGWVAWRVLAPHERELAAVATMQPSAILPFAQTLLVALFSSALAFLGVTAGLDWIWQRQRFLVRMRMSREEMKEEFRQSEGDPHVKGKIKQMRLARARKRMMSNVPKATLIVTNPTHYAVALRYIAGETPAPICMAKGMDSVALKIREIGAENDIPIIEDPPLARLLYANVEVDETIPREHYEAVAKVIGFIMSAKALRRRRAPPLGSTSGPRAPL
jgi:flagellar biosynthetic protein FlhB